MIRQSLVWSLFLVVVLIAGSTAAAQTYSESPMLAERVAAGELPPVEERLPNEPFVVGPGVLIAEGDLDWEVGRYGGTMRFAHDSAEWQGDVFTMCFQAFFRAPGTSTDDIRPNILSDYSISEDNTRFEFTLREGLRWSDGTPVTTEDIRFTYEDVLMNEDLTPIFPAAFRSGGHSGGTPMELEIIDDYTFAYTFDEPYGGFMAEVTIKGWAGYAELMKPAHFLKDYHIDYTSLEDMREDLEAEELDDEWYTLFHAKDVPHWSLTNRKAIGFPVLYPWVRVPSAAGIMIYERNPYYHAVDTEGNQLPYIDRLHSQEVADVDMGAMLAITGEIDMFSLSGHGQLPMYQEHAERGGYEIHFFDSHTDRTLFLNLTYEDPVWREVVNDVRFRQAISHAIDREEIIDSVYLGFAEKTPLIPAEFDPDAAAALLDEIGLDQRDSAGYRVGPDGNTFHLYLEVANHRGDFIPTVELITEHLNEIGLRTTMNQNSIELQGQRQAANEAMTSYGWFHSPLWGGEIVTDFLPGNFGWGQAWATWRTTQGSEGEEPPAWVQELYDIYDTRVASVPESPEYVEATNRLHEIYWEMLPAIAVVNITDMMVANRNLGNIPHGGTEMSQKRSGSQYFFKE